MRGPITHLNLSKSYRGGERQTELLIRGLAERGYVQRLIARTGAPLAERFPDVPDLETEAVSGLFAAARACGRVPALVHGSSVGVYSPGPKQERVDESWPRNGVRTSFYARHKAEADTQILRVTNLEIVDLPANRDVELAPRPPVKVNGDS